MTGRIAPTLIASYLVPELSCENLRRYLASQPLLNVFDRERGY